jgi:hypothetical protein
MEKIPTLINLMQEPNALEKKMKDMRERFRMLQMTEDFGVADDSNTPKTGRIERPDSANSKTRRDSMSQNVNIVPNHLSPVPSTAQEPIKESVAAAANRWTKLRKVVRGNTGISTRTSGAIGEQQSPRESPRYEDGTPVARTDQTVMLEMEDIKLMDLWKDENYFKSYPLESKVLPEITLPSLQPDLETKFAEESQPVQVEISRIPEEAVQQKKDTIEQALLFQQKTRIESVKKLQTDIIWREDLARNRVKDLEEKSRKRMEIERTKMIKSALDRESSMANQFRRAREELEEGIRRQEAALKEHFGRSLVHNEVSHDFFSVSFINIHSLFWWSLVGSSQILRVY